MEYQLLEFHLDLTRQPLPLGPSKQESNQSRHLKLFPFFSGHKVQLDLPSLIGLIAD